LTIRRDLNRLERSDLLTRVRGGAAANKSLEPSFVEVATGDHHARDAVARRAAELVQDGDVLLLDIRTTVRARWRGAPQYRSLVGLLTEDCLRQVRAEQLFMGTSGVRSDSTVVDTTAVDFPGTRAMIAAADTVVLVADESKFPGSGYATVCGVEALDVVVTTKGADRARSGHCVSLGLR
jgi:DeoR/GlpR family transcriptional regulator of sugar metabolism